MNSYRLNELTIKWTAFPSFDAMVNDSFTSYRPTIRPDLSPELEELADAYDAAQAERGDSRRAYRG